VEDARTPRTAGFLSIHYIKSNIFRVVHVDGALGGVTPGLKVQMALFSERVPIPRRTVHELSDEGVPEQPPIESEGRDGVVREVEVEAIMDLSTARSLHAWLADKIRLLESIVAERAKP
jgi:hypothetical protein